MHATPVPPCPSGARRAPGLWAAAGLIATYFLLQAVAATLLALAIGAVAGLGLEGPEAGQAARSVLQRPTAQALLAMFSLAISAPLTLWLAHWKWPQLWPLGKPPGLGFARPRHGWFFAVAIVAGLAAPLLGGLLTQWLAHHHTVTQDIRQLGGHTPPGWRIPLALMVVGVGPLVEELLFRGVLLSALMRRCSLGWAIAISSAAFALVHLPGLQFQWYAVPALALLALVLAWLRLHSASIWPAVVAHAANNLLAVTVWFAASGPG